MRDDNGQQQLEHEQQQWEEEYKHLFPFDREFKEFVAKHEEDYGRNLSEAKTPF